MRPAEGPKRDDAGALALSLHGEICRLRPSGGLWIETYQALVVADLHLEKGSAYASRGQMLPPFDTRETLRRLRAEVEALQPERLVFLGDTFHDGNAEGRLDWRDRADLEELATGRELVWVSGNHDPGGPAGLGGRTVDEIRLGALRLRHEPEPGLQPGEVSGHLHPCARIRSPRGTVRRRCFATDGQRMILPAFGAYAGGLNIRDEAFAGLFREAPLLGALGIGAVHAVGWRSSIADASSPRAEAPLQAQWQGRRRRSP